MTTNDLRNKLNRVRNLVGRSRPARKTDHPERYRSMAEQIGAELLTNFAGAYCLRRTIYSKSYRHGEVLMSSLDSRRWLPLSAFSPDDQPGEVALRDLVYIDTETTGLGGAGVVPFLIGCGSHTSSGFEVRQYIIPDYSDETAMLEALLEEFGDKSTLVSYNGRAFDIPIVRNRMIINRVAREVPMAGHIDLLQATRRLFRRRLKDCTLGNVERRLFGFKRQDDIPGYLIPSVYFEWLSEQSLDLMTDVLEHNCLDIVTLAFLADHIARIFESEGEALAQPEDIHSLARVYGRRKQNKSVNELYRRMAAESPAEPPEDARWYHSLIFKRSGDWEQAVELWQSLEDSPTREGYWANLELAKYFEHRCKEYAQALTRACRARRICPYGSTHQAQLDHRLRRLTDRLTAATSLPYHPK